MSARCICGQEARFSHVCLNGVSLPGVVQLPDAFPPKEHPDTIALRECRAELELQRQCAQHYRLQAESAESERDTRDKQISALQLAFDRGVAERDTALKQVALQESWRKSAESERDTARAGLEKMENRISLCVDGRVYDACVRDLHALQAKVARAVANLKLAQKYTTDVEVGCCVSRALEALR